MLWFAHSVNGDFERDYYEAPMPLTPETKDRKNSLDLTKWPWSLWPVITVLYEWVLVNNTVVTFAFWVVEAPFMCYAYFWSPSTPLYLHGELFISHSLPFIGVLFEWWHNSIRVSTARVWLITLIVSVYPVCLMVSELYIVPLEDMEKVYYSMDFAENPYRATLLLSGVLMSAIATLHLWTKLTESRLGPGTIKSATQM